MNKPLSQEEARAAYRKAQDAAVALLKEFPALYEKCLADARERALASFKRRGGNALPAFEADVNTWVEMFAASIAMPRLLLNRAKCLKCEQTIESSHRHDFVTCSCGNVFVDGGLDYTRRGWDSYGPGYEELSTYESDDQLRLRLANACVATAPAATAPPAT